MVNSPRARRSFPPSVTVAGITMNTARNFNCLFMTLSSSLDLNLHRVIAQRKKARQHEDTPSGLRSKFPNDTACYNAPAHFPLFAYRGSDYVSSHHYYRLKRRARSPGFSCARRTLDFAYPGKCTNSTLREGGLSRHSRTQGMCYWGKELSIEQTVEIFFSSVITIAGDL